MTQFNVTTTTILLGGACALAIFGACAEIARGQSLPGGGTPGLSVSVASRYAQVADLGAPRAIDGVITRVEWINPSVVIRVKDNATGQEYGVVTDNPNTLLRAGGSRETMAVGTPIRVMGYPARDGACEPTCRLFANPVGMTSNGKPLFPTAEGALPAARTEEVAASISILTNSIVRSGQEPAK